MSSLPPGPRSRILATAGLALDPYNFYPKMLKRFGDPFTIRAFNGTLLATADPEHIRTIFSTRPEHYDPFAAETLRELIGEGSLLVLTGERHMRERKLLMPRFHGSRMRAYGALMQRVARAHAERWRPGERVVMQDITTSISRDVIIGAIFGVDDDSEARNQTYRDAIIGVVDSAHPALFFSRAMHRSFLGMGPWAKFQRASQRLYDLVLEDINARRAEPDSVSESREDILSLLLDAEYEDGGKLSDDDLLSELVTLLFAGHETSAIALAWAFYRLHLNPVILARLREELDAHADDEPDDIARLPYLSAVVRETLRLFPIIPDAVRLLKKPLEIGEYTVPAGKGLAILSAVVHHNPEIYPDPMRFSPDRFLERRYKPWEFMPFGGGHRRCIGAAFAEYEMKLVLATILRDHNLALRETRPVKAVRRNVTMGPKTGVRMQVIGPRS